MTILNNEQVRQIREAYAKGALQKDLGKQYGLRQTTISKVVCGETHIDAGGPITHMGRAKGNRHPLAKMTEAAVLEMRFMHDALETPPSELAAMFGITVGQARAICKRKAWAHVQ